MMNQQAESDPTVMRSAKVAFFGINYPPEHTAVAPYAGALMKGLVRRGIPLRVLTTHPHYPSWRIAEGYGQWTRDEHLEGVPVRRLLHYVPARPEGLRRLLSEITFGLRVATQRWGHPDVVLLVSPALFSSAVAMLRARWGRRRPKTIVWVQDLYGVGLAETGGNDSIAAKIAHFVESWVFRNADRVVVIHQRFASRIVADLGVSADKVEVIRNWTHLEDMAPIDRDAAREALGWGDETVVLHSGNMGVKQGLENVVDAARVAERRGLAVRFVLLGDGSQRASLERAGVGLTTLQFISPLADAEFAAALQAADVLLVNELPGVSEMSVPSKLTSYFAAGRPVCAATDAAGITAAEVESAGAGVVVPAGSPERLVDAVVALAADAHLCESLGARGRDYRMTVLSEQAAVTSFERLFAKLTRR